MSAREDKRSGGRGGEWGWAERGGAGLDGTRRAGRAGVFFLERKGGPPRRGRRAPATSAKPVMGDQYTESTRLFVQTLPNTVPNATLTTHCSVLTTALNVACTMFRDEATKSRFYKWPEPQSSHTLCCGRGDLLANYSYPGRPCDPLVIGIYYDVRLVRHLRWYLFHWDLSYLDKTQPQATTVCEYSILHHFYKQWFLTNVFFYGVFFGFALIFFTQGTIWCVWLFWLKRPLAMWSDDFDAALIACFHMGLLGLNGFAAVEAAGHGALVSYSSDVFSCAMSMYSYLTLLAMFNMVFEHVGYEEECLVGKRLHLAVRQGLERTDWRWQPVWAQLAAGVCMYMYCTTVETSLGELEQSAGQVIPVVVLAIFWSGGHTMVYVVQVIEIVVIKLLKAAGIIRRLRSIRILKPSEACAVVNLVQIATTSTGSNPNPVLGITSVTSNPASISATSAINPIPAVTPTSSSTTAAANPIPTPTSITNAANPTSSSATPATNPTSSSLPTANPSLTPSPVRRIP